MPPALLLPLLNAVVYTGVAIGIGAVSVRFLLLTRCGLALSERVPPQRSAATAAALALGAVLLAAPARIALQVSQLADPGEAWGPILSGVLVDTSLGRAMQLQAIWAAAALMAFSVSRVGRQRGWFAAAVAMVILADTPGLAGHPAASDHPTLGLTISALHVLAAGVWIGTLFHLWRATRAVSESTVAAMLTAFHPIALGAAGVLLATGLYQAYSALGGVGQLATTGWGRVLSAKLLLVLVVAALGRRHWKTAEVRLAAGERAALTRSFALELRFAGFVFALTAVLASVAPPT